MLQHIVREKRERVSHRAIKLISTKAYLKLVLEETRQFTRLGNELTHQIW